MQKIRSTLKCLIWLSVVITLALVILFETGMLTPGSLADDAATLFMATAVMELLSLALVPLAIGMFRMPFVRRRIVSPNYKGYLRWSVFRIGILAFLMLLNVVCYYLFAGVAFGYLAIIAFLCLMVVYPTNERCGSEFDQNKASRL